MVDELNLLGLKIWFVIIPSSLCIFFVDKSKFRIELSNVSITVFVYNDIRSHTL